MTTHPQLPEWMRPDFSVRAAGRGYIVVDGETPVGGGGIHLSLASANSVARDCQRRREAMRERFRRIHDA